MNAATVMPSYWDRVAATYQRHTRISIRDFHYGPLLAGDRALGLLPPEPAVQRCLEVGAGAGQNSVVLARRGADCVALDSSNRQVEHGRRLARRCGVRVDFRLQTMESLPDRALGRFDLVHSVHALEFVADPAAVLDGMARMLKPGGWLLLATLHPLATADPVHLGRRRMGVIVADYFNPPEDTRGGRNRWPTVAARPLPFGVLLDAIRHAGCRLDRVVEPRPPPLDTLDESAIRRVVAYESRAWRLRYPLLAAIPFTLIVRAQKER